MKITDLESIVVPKEVFTVMVDGKFGKLAKNKRAAIRWAKKKVTNTNNVQVADGTKITDLWVNGIKLK